MLSKSNILIFGIGNSGRSDDGLGWTFLDKIKHTLPDNFDIEYRYQLQVEDAELATQYDQIIFVDADKEIYDDGYIWKACFPKSTQSFSSHTLNPETILYLTKTIYNKQPKGYLLGISGENYKLSIGLSENSEKNLLKAISFFNSKLYIPS